MAEASARTLTAPITGFALATITGEAERLEPIVGQSPLAVELLWRAPCKLRPGDWLERLRLFTRGACCFSGPALVRAVSEADHAELGHGLVLTLEMCSPDSHAEQPSVDSYTDPEVITDTIANLLSADVVVTVERTDLKQNRSPVTAHVMERSGDSSDLVLALTSARPPAVRRGQQVAVHADVYGTRLVIVTTYRARRGELLFLDWPKLLRIWWRRSADRLPTDDTTLALDLVLPITGESAVRPVCNISSSGVAVRLAPTDALLVGVEVGSISMRLPDATISAHGVVRNIHSDLDGGLVAGVELVPSDTQSRTSLHDFVQQQVHWQIHRARRVDLEGLWPLWDALGLFSRPHVALTPGAAALEAGRKALLDRGHELMVAVVGTSEGARQGTAELVRTYHNTWTLQHFGSTIEPTLSREQLLAAVCEEALRQDSFTALHALCEPSDSEPLLAAALRLELGPSEFSQRRCALLVPEATTHLPEGRNDELHAPEEDEREWLTARLATTLSELELAALDLTVAELTLDSLAAVYRDVGLSRRRDLRIALGVTGPMGFALIEHASRGVSLTGYGDIARLFAIVGDRQAQQHTLAILAEASVALGRTWGASPLVLVNEELAPLLCEVGYNLVGSRLEVIVARSAVARLVGHLRLHA